MKDPLSNLWKRENKKLIYHTPIFDLVSYDVTHPKSKKVRPYYVLETRSWVNVIAITPENEMVLVWQYRHGLNQYCLELPGGVVEEEGVDAILLSAKRELEEETGYTAENWELLGKVSGNPAIFNNYSYTYIAKNATKTKDTNFDEGEDIEVELYPVQKVYELLKEGRIHHSMMVAALNFWILREHLI